MEDQARTNQELVEENASLKQRIEELEQSESERRQTEEALRESEERLHFHTGNSPMAVIERDTNFIVKRWTGAAGNIFGWSCEEAMGKSVMELRMVYEEDMPIVQRVIQRLLDGKSKYVVSSTRNLTKNGKVIHCEWYNSVLHDSAGKIISVMSQVLDITERKRTEEQLKRQEMQVRTILESTCDGILAVDNKGRVIKTNQRFAELWKIPPELLEQGNDEALQTCVLGQLVDADAFLQKVQALYESTAVDFDTILFKDGRILERYSCPLLNGGAINGRVWSFRDITERRRMEEERKNLEERLQNAEKVEMLGKLAGRVAHDLNNVLGVLSGYSELLIERIPADSPLRLYAANILKSSGKAAAIVEDLLTLARRGVRVMEVAKLNNIIANLLATPEFDKLAASYPTVIVKTDLAEYLLNISGSPVHLEKTILNLVANAVEAIVGGGGVIIKTENRYLDKVIDGYQTVMEGEYVVLTVSDTGKGIPQSELKNIFEPFYSKKSMGRSGTGLGLAIVWGTVQDHNGYIDVRSREGGGTTFTLYFPATREMAKEEARKIPVEQYLGHGESVLVVDDVEGQRNMAIALLRQLGYQVNGVPSGEAAVESIKNNKADILVLDMIMEPGIDGLETYQRILEINPHQKAIIVSGFSETDRTQEAKKLGAGAYVKKPYLSEKIGIAVRNELDRK